MGSKINSMDKKEYSEEILEIVDNMSLMDDELMAKVFDENLSATTLLLSTILQREIEVESTKGQFDMRSPIVGGRSIRLDIHAKEKNGEQFDCEVQRADDGASPKRVRFHSAMLDARMLKAGQDFDELKDSYVIFITENDYYGEGKPLYYVNRVVDDNKRFQDGNHIIYVNASYKGDDDLGKLLKDMTNKTMSGFYNKELEEGVRHFKETKEGRDIMSEAVQKFAEKYAKEYSEGQYDKGKESGVIDSIRNLMKNMKMSAEQAMDAIGIPKSEHKKYMTML